MNDDNTNYPSGNNGLPRSLETQNSDGERRFSPSVSRNRDVLLEAFLDNVSVPASVLEIGSGTGEHGVYFTDKRDGLSWTFSEFNEEALGGIVAWIEHAGRDRLFGPYLLDAASNSWGEQIDSQSFDVIFTANVVHIAPIAVLEGIIAGAARMLSKAGRLLFYGPFARDGIMVESNFAFDADLKRRDASWGVRDLERELIPLATAAGLDLVVAAHMPKNNYFLVFEHS